MKILKLTVFLAVIAGLSGGALSVVYNLTDPIIEAAALEAEEENLEKIYSNSEFIEVDTDLEEYKLLDTCYEVRNNDETQGYVYKVATYGYGGYITYLLALDNDGTYKGYEVIDCSSETKGFGTKVGDNAFKETIVGKEIGDSIDTISGATISSTAVVKGINQAVEHYELNFR